MTDKDRTQRRAPGRASRRRRRHRRLKVLVAIVCLIVAFGAAYLIDSAVYYNKVHAGVTVSGLPLGGLTRDEATAALTRYVEEAQGNPILLTSGGKSWELMPEDVGTEIDTERAIDEAMAASRKSNFLVDAFRRLRLYFSGTDIALQGTIDTILMDYFLAGLARALDVPPVNPGLVIDGDNIEVIEGHKGTVVDQAALRARLKALLFSLHNTEVNIPMKVEEPKVRVDDTQMAVEQARVMIGAPVTLAGGGKRWTLSEEEIAAFMAFKAEEKDGVATLVPYLSAEKMGPFLEEVAREVAVEAKDASFDSNGKVAWVVPGVPGKALDVEKTAAALTAAALKTGKRSAQVAVKTTEPDLTTEEAEAMGIKDKLGGYTTEPYAGTWERQINVKITTKYASNIILAPGEEYNFDKIIGPRTEERGYQLAKGIIGKGKLEDVLGGGICQVSTTLFNAVFEAGLKITERHNHTLYIDHYPPGRDATVTAGGYNFRFVNDTANYVLVRGSSDGITTTFSIYGTKDGRKVESEFSGFTYGKKRPEVTVTNTSLGTGTTLVQTEGQSKRSCWVKRIVTYADGTKHTDMFYSDWPEFRKVIEVGVATGTTTTTTAKAPKTTTTTKPKPPKTTATTKPKPATTVVTDF